MPCRPNPRNAAIAQLSRASNVTLRGNHLQCRWVESAIGTGTRLPLATPCRFANARCASRHLCTLGLAWRAAGQPLASAYHRSNPQHQGHRANSLRSDSRDSVGLLRSPQTLKSPRFEAATDERWRRCGGLGGSRAARFNSPKAAASKSQIFSYYHYDSCLRTIFVT